MCPHIGLGLWNPHFLSLPIYLMCSQTRELWGWKVKMLVAQWCPTLWDPMDLLGFSVQGMLQARILQWVAISFFRESSQTRDGTWFSCIAGRFFTSWATRGARELRGLNVFKRLLLRVASRGQSCPLTWFWKQWDHANITWGLMRGLNLGE